MKIYGTTYSITEPQAIEITSIKVFTATDIQSIERACEGQTENCYSYTLTEYDKDEYIALMAKNNADIAALQDELAAAKILLGVE